MNGQPAEICIYGNSSVNVTDRNSVSSLKNISRILRNYDGLGDILGNEIIPGKLLKIWKILLVGYYVHYELSRAYYRDTLWLSTISGNRTDFLENLEFVLGNVFVNLHTIHDSAASILRCSRRFHISDP